MAVLGARARWPRRHPGVYFEEVSPRKQALPRMDIAVFVGFAQTGPLHVPVAVEDVVAFQDIFGEDVLLAYGGNRQPILSCLGASVRSFFQNGGQRCWVVRVAGANAETNIFQIPGLVKHVAGTLTAATAQARSPGSWADDITVASALMGRTIAIRSITQTDPDVMAVEAELAADEVLLPGDLVRIRLIEQDKLCFVEVASVQPQGRTDEGLMVIVLTGRPFWFTDADVWLGSSRPADIAANMALSETQATGHIVTFDLWTRQPGHAPSHISNLAFSPRHPRYWGKLPSDEGLFLRRLDDDAPAARATDVDLLAGQSSDARFPLSGDEAVPPLDPDALSATTAVYLPVGMQPSPTTYVSASHSSADAATRDGLDHFPVEAFLDSDLAQDMSTIADLMARADYLRYTAPDSLRRNLRGIFAALSIPEASLLAIPDAVHLDWELIDEVLPESLNPPVNGTHDDGQGGFAPCHKLIAPALTGPDTIDEGQSFEVQWTLLPQNPNEEPSILYTFQEAADPTFLEATTLYEGTGSDISVLGNVTLVVQPLPAGHYYFRLRVRQGSDSAVSPGLVVSVRPKKKRVVVQTSAGVLATALRIHRHALKLCAARGDMVAVLAMPLHYREDAAALHAAALLDMFGETEPSVLTYGGLFHPWLTVREDALRSIPPDGAVCGAMANQALTHGAWTAAANRPFDGALGLAPALLQDRVADLATRQVNVILRDPRGYLLKSEDTLSVVPELLPIHVRRLLILLRRLALDLGVTYAFEPNGRELERTVERSFGEVLRRLYTQGAFAGAREESAYRLDVTSGIDSPKEADAGRFIVDIAVAPAEAVEVIHVRLIQRGSHGSVVEGA